MKLLSLFLIFTFLSTGLFAQSVAWRVDFPEGSTSGPMIELDNGNLLTLTFGPLGGAGFSVYAPDGEGLVSAGFSDGDCCRFVHLQEIGPDEYFALNNRGRGFRISDNFTEFTDLGDAFPPLSGSGVRLKVLGTTGDTLTARAWGADLDGQVEARIHYNEGMVSNTRIIGWEEIFIAYGPDGQSARLTSRFPVWQLTTFDSTTSATDTLWSDTNDHNYRHLFFRADGSLALLGTFDRLSAPRTFMMEHDLATGIRDTTFFGIPEFSSNLGVDINNHYQIGDQLLLTGALGGDEFRALAVGLSPTNDFVWRLQDVSIEGRHLNSILSLAAANDDMTTLYLAGNAGQSDVVPSGNAYLLRIDEAPTPVRNTAARVFSVFPNPASDQVRFTGLPTAVRELSLSDAGGRIIRKFTDTDLVSVRGLPAGVYYLRGNDGENSFIGKVIVK